MEVMLNPGRRFWVKRVEQGLIDTGATLSSADDEQIIRLVADHVGIDMHASAPSQTATTSWSPAVCSLIQPSSTRWSSAIASPAGGNDHHRSRAIDDRWTATPRPCLAHSLRVDGDTR